VPSIAARFFTASVCGDNLGDDKPLGRIIRLSNLVQGRLEPFA